MKRPIILTLILLLFLQATAQVPLEWRGRWWKTYLEDVMLPLNLSMQDALYDWKDANAVSTHKALADIQQMLGLEKDTVISQLYPVIYSPLQSPNGLAADEFSFRNDTLRYIHRQTGIRMTLVYNPDDSTFSGVFRQGMLKADVRFLPCDTLLTFNRPQTPQMPYSFIPEQVSITHKDAHGRKITLSGTLAIPKGKPASTKGYPAVVLISGSGQQNRDEEIFFHKPFLVMAEYLAQHGIATLRYDDRGIGSSTGNFDEATTTDFASDAEAVFEMLRSHEKIDSKRVGLLGHSEGGLIAPMIASRNNKVAFIILEAGPGCSGAEVLLQQNEQLFQMKGTPDSLIAVRINCMRELFSLADTVASEQLLQAITRTIDHHCSPYSKEELSSIGLSKSDALSWHMQLTNPWLKEFLSTDPANYLPKVKCPILALNGTKDFQVPCEPNLRAIQHLATNSRRLVIMPLPGKNHLMQNCTIGDTKEYIFTEETIAPEVLYFISDFILSNAK